MRNLLKAAVVAIFSLCWINASSAQSIPLKYFTTASTNATSVRATRTLLKAILPINTTATVYYLKLYNKASTPVCGTDTPSWTVPIPSNTGGVGGVSIPPPEGLMFPLGLGFCITGGLPDNDNTNAAAGIVLNLGVSGY